MRHLYFQLSLICWKEGDKTDKERRGKWWRKDKGLRKRVILGENISPCLLLILPLIMPELLWPNNGKRDFWGVLQPGCNNCMCSQVLSAKTWERGGQGDIVAFARTQAMLEERKITIKSSKKGSWKSRHAKIGNLYRILSSVFCISGVLTFSYRFELFIIKLMTATVTSLYMS